MNSPPPSESDSHSSEIVPHATAESSEIDQPELVVERERAHAFFAEIMRRMQTTGAELAPLDDLYADSDGAVGAGVVLYSETDDRTVEAVLEINDRSGKQMIDLSYGRIPLEKIATDPNFELVVSVRLYQGKLVPEGNMPEEVFSSVEPEEASSAQLGELVLRQHADDIRSGKAVSQIDASRHLTLEGWMKDVRNRFDYFTPLSADQLARILDDMEHATTDAEILQPTDSDQRTIGGTALERYWDD